MGIIKRKVTRGKNMEFKRIAAAALAAVTVLGYSAGYYPAGLIKPASSITAEAAKQKFNASTTFSSLGRNVDTNTDESTFYGYLRKYFDYEWVASSDTVVEYRIKGFKGDSTRYYIPAPYTDDDGKEYRISYLGYDYSYNLSGTSTIKDLYLPYSLKYIGAEVAVAGNTNSNFAHWFAPLIIYLNRPRH